MCEVGVCCVLLYSAIMVLRFEKKRVCVCVEVFLTSRASPVYLYVYIYVDTHTCSPTAGDHFL